MDISAANKVLSADGKNKSKSNTDISSDKYSSSGSKETIADKNTTVVTVDPPKRCHCVPGVLKPSQQQLSPIALAAEQLRRVRRPLQW